MTVAGAGVENSANSPVAKTAGLGRTLRTVIFGLLGVAANRSDLADGSMKVSPPRLLIVAVIFMAVFVGSLITLASKIAGG